MDLASEVPHVWQAALSPAPLSAHVSVLSEVSSACLQALLLKQISPRWGARHFLPCIPVCKAWGSSSSSPQTYCGPTLGPGSGEKAALGGRVRSPWLWSHFC